MPASLQRLAPLRELVLMPELSPRARLCEETVIRYMESFDSLPPVRVQEGTNIVVDGYHRIEAAQRMGLEQLVVEEEPIPDEDLILVAGLLNAQHGQPLTRTERNKLAVTLVNRYGRLREEVAALFGLSVSAITIALREHQLNEQLSEKLGSTVQVINSAHVRALYRVGPEQREQLLEVIVNKVDDNGEPYPLTGAELKLLVDRMLDPATPAAELNRLLNDPRARPKPPVTESAEAPRPQPYGPEAESNTRPWEREWESPLKGGDSEAFDRVRSVDEEIDRAGGYAGEERQIQALLKNAMDNARDRQNQISGEYNPFWGSADAPADGAREVAANINTHLLQGVDAAARALEQIVPQVEPEEIRTQVEAVMLLLKGLLQPQEPETPFLD